MDSLTLILNKLEVCVRQQIYESLETDGVEVKSVPPTGGAWDSIRQSICGFLNSRGGTVILGVKDEKKPHRHYTFTGYTENNSGNLSELRCCFQDGRDHDLDVSEYLRIEIRPFDAGQVAVVRVSALPEDKKFCRYKKNAYERIADRDELIPANRIEDQEERKREMETFRELRPVPDASLSDLSLQRINELIQLINQGQSRPIETLKSSIADSVAFLESRRLMLKDSQVTTLGVLVAANSPADHLLFRSQLDAFVDVPNTVAQDKKNFRDNILQLMEFGQSWTLRNIMTGVSRQAAGTMVAEYPEDLIRESINNALAHRDYTINRPVQLTLKPRHSLNIRNPGQLPSELVFEKTDDAIPVRRIFPNPKARNPRLAEILKLHNKWEGRGKGMSDLVNFALANQTDLPHYLFHSSEEISLCIPAGKVLDESMEEWLGLMDGFLVEKSEGRPLTDEHRMVLAYLLKSEKANRLGLYTLALTPGNNHFGAIADLKSWGLITLHPASDQFRQVYLVCRDLAHDDHHAELNRIFGGEYLRLDDISRQVLNMICAAEKYSSQGGLNAKQAFRLIKSRMPQETAKRGDDEFYRAVRRRVELMAPEKDLLKSLSEKGEFIATPDRVLGMGGTPSKPIFRLNREFVKPLL